jgi:glycosyltransferase involved in cell wall biosynthesis
MMRTLHVLSSLDPKGGGPAHTVRSLAEGYLRDGHEVEIVTLDNPKAVFVQGLPYPVHAFGPSLGIYGFNLRILPWLKKNIDRFDGIVVGGLWQYHSIALWMAAQGHASRYVVFPHGMLDPYFNRAYPLKVLKKLPYWMLAERRLLRDAYRVLFTSEAEQRLAAESVWHCAGNGLVVPYGTPGPTRAPEPLRSAFFRLLPQLEGKRFLLYLGRIHEKKGLDLLIEAFAKHAAADPALDLVIAGPDNSGLSRKLQALAARLGIQDRITWPGMLAGDVKWGAFYAAEAFVLPSHQENFGIAVAEALACSLPVLISDQVNIFEEVERDGAALVAPDTLEGTADIIGRWIALSAGQRAGMQLAARRSFESRFNTQRLPAIILSLFEDTHTMSAKVESTGD